MLETLAHVITQRDQSRAPRSCSSTFVIKHVLFFSELEWLELPELWASSVHQSVLPLVSCLICLRVQACLYAGPVLVVVVWFILER